MRGIAEWIPCDLTNRNTQDNTVVDKLVKPIPNNVRHVSGDSAYDTNGVYTTLSEHFPSADLVIPPSNNAIYDDKNHFFRNRNLLERKYYGSMGWQKRRNYGKRNSSELAIQRYKKILGNKLHSKDFNNQKIEAVIGCSILNKMTLISDAQVRLVS